MIPFLVFAAVAWWLAAPDPVTAGARTAAGTGARAAGAGVRDHWASGRDGRKLTRTARRDRWSKGGGFWRNLLRLEHGAVITAKGVKGAAGITRAAVRPVPAAAKAGWSNGWERHRAKAGNRSVPVALDPPWWRREQPQVQPGEQPPEQVGEQGGNSSGTGPERTAYAAPVHPSGIPGEKRCDWCDERPRETKRGKLAVCSACAREIDGQLASAADVWQNPPVTGTVCDAVNANGPDADMTTGGAAAPSRGDCSFCGTTPVVATNYRGDRACAAHTKWLREEPKPWAPPVNRCKARSEHEFDKIFKNEYGSLEAIGRELRTVRCGNEAGPDGFCDDHRAGDGDSPPLKATPDPADTTTDPTATPAPAKGAPMSVNMPSEINDLTTLHSFAQAVIDDAEENGPGSQYAAAAASLSEYFGRDFGREVNATASAFEEAADALNKAWAAMVEAAEAMKNESLATIGG